jgi:hypothetical protein
MHHLLFAFVLSALAGIAIFVPGAMGVAILGCVLATSVWLYFSLRHVTTGPNQLAALPPDNISPYIGSDSPGPTGPANVCADFSAGGLGCESGHSDSSHE